MAPVVVAVVVNSNYLLQIHSLMTWYLVGL